jgi:hypothetical protein
VLICLAQIAPSCMQPGGLPVAEDSGVPPLPRRVPGEQRRPGRGPSARPVLSDSVMQRILAALDTSGDKASPQDHAAPTERPASLPRRVRGASNGPEPPALLARPKLPASSPRSRSEEGPTEPVPVVSASMSSGVTEEIWAQPDIAVQPEPATAVPTDPQPVPAQRSPAEQQPDRQDRREAKRSSPEKVPDQQENRPAGPGKVQARRTKEQARPPKPAPPKAGTRPPNPAPARPPKPAAPKEGTRPSKPAPPKAGSRRHRGLATRVILALALLSAGSLAFLLTRHAGTAEANSPKIGVGPEVTVSDRAAGWVAKQVSRTAIVSCDPMMCQALEAHGISAASLLVLRPGQVHPLRSEVIIATAAVRRMVGSRLSYDAPAVIASFGSGSIQISIRVIFPQGATAYWSALRKDIAGRKAGEAALLPQNKRITMSAATRRQLANGKVDSRLILAIANLASRRPVSIVAFGDLAPGASPGIPLRSADLAEIGGRAAPSPLAQVRFISAFLHQQGGFYLSGHVQSVRLAGGRNVLRIEFTAPTQLGLLN